MPIQHVPSLASLGPFSSLHTAFKAAVITDPHAEISYKEGCIRMHFFHRLNYKIALKRQQDMDALGEIVAGPRLPEPHRKNDGSQWFYLREVEAYTADARDE